MQRSSQNRKVQAAQIRVCLFNAVRQKDMGFWLGKEGQQMLTVHSSGDFLP